MLVEVTVVVHLVRERRGDFMRRPPRLPLRGAPLLEPSVSVKLQHEQLQRRPMKILDEVELHHVFAAAPRAQLRSGSGGKECRHALTLTPTRATTTHTQTVSREWCVCVCVCVASATAYLPHGLVHVATVRLLDQAPKTASDVPQRALQLALALRRRRRRFVLALLERELLTARAAAAAAWGRVRHRACDTHTRTHTTALGAR